MHSSNSGAMGHAKLIRNYHYRVWVRTNVNRNSMQTGQCWGNYGHKYWYNHYCGEL